MYNKWENSTKKPEDDWWMLQPTDTANVFKVVNYGLLSRQLRQGQLPGWVAVLQRRQAYFYNGGYLIWLPRLLPLIQPYLNRKFKVASDRNR